MNSENGIPIHIDHATDTLSVHFDDFSIASYPLFLRVKSLPEYNLTFHPDTETYTVTAPARFAHLLGVDAGAAPPSDLPFAPFLFDDQVAIVEAALAAKRYACWSDCGLGKTLIQLEFARHVIHRTGGRFLIVTLNEVVPQFMEMCREFYGDSLPIIRLATRDAMRHFCRYGSEINDAAGNVLHAPLLAITNYEKFNPDKGRVENQVVNEIRHLSGFALDESHRLAQGGGKQKWALVKSTKGVPYKLSCTATPAPNDTIEFASQASFLERMRSEGEIIWTYFVRDPKTQEWCVKRHAKKAFYEFMSSWSIYVRDPRKYGWRKDHKDIPEPIVFKHEIEPTTEQIAWAQKTAGVDKYTGQMALFQTASESTVKRGKSSQAAKGFVYVKTLTESEDGTGASREGRIVRRIASRKPRFVADLIRSEAACGLQVLVWTVFDAESDIIAEELRGAGIGVDGAARGKPVPFKYDVLTGRNKGWERLEMLERFRRGETPVLISRAKMLGFGLNFQMCGSMIFSSWSDSYVSWYQAIRRAVRYGQTKQVRVHVPIITLLEGQMLENIFHKEEKHMAAIEEMEELYVKARNRLNCNG